MLKLKELWNKPITWGDYFKLCGACAALSGLTYAGAIAYLKYKFDQEIDERDYSKLSFIPNENVEKESE